MKRRSKASTKRRSIVDPTLEKPLLNLHAATDIDSFWKAVQQVIEATLPTCFIGLTLQHTPVFPRIIRATKKISERPFPTAPVENYLAAHPRRKLILASDVFPDEHRLKKSLFYRNYMAPVNGRYAIGLLLDRQEVAPTALHPISNGARSPSLTRTRAYRTRSFSGISTPNSFTDGFVALESAVGLSESSGL